MTSETGIGSVERLKAMLEKAGLSEKPSYQIGEVSRIFSVSNSTVYRMIANEGLIALRINGSSMRIDWNSLVDFIERSTADAVEDFGGEGRT
jgi:excisionase family DNA binding protein